MNNYERIKSLDMEQLAYFLCSLDNNIIKRVNKTFGKDIIQNICELELTRYYYRYLKQEVKDE